MSDELRKHIETVVLGEQLKAYLVVYRVSTKAEGSLLGDRQKRYSALVEKLEKLDGAKVQIFEDEGHLSTSCWMVRSTLNAAGLGGDLHNVLDKREDHLAVFPVVDTDYWVMPSARR